MKIKIKMLLLFLLFVIAPALLGKTFAQVELPRIETACETKSGFLYTFNDGFSNRDKCEGGSRRVILIGERGPQGEKGDPGPQGIQGEKGEKGDPGEPPENGRLIVDIAQVRGSLWETASTVEVPTPDSVTVNCQNPCALWVNYDVDTRNSGSPSHPLEFNHLYNIYIDGVNQAVFNQAHMPFQHAAVPLALNGVFPVSAGEHTVAIYTRTTGGHLEQHESHLQVLAIE